MSPIKVEVAAGVKVGRAKSSQVVPGKGWRLVAPGKQAGRRAILIKKFKVGGKEMGIFHILPGTR